MRKEITITGFTITPVPGIAGRKFNSWVPCSFVQIDGMHYAAYSTTQKQFQPGQLIPFYTRGKFSNVSYAAKRLEYICLYNFYTVCEYYGISPAEMIKLFNIQYDNKHQDWLKAATEQSNNDHAQACLSYELIFDVFEFLNYFTGHAFNANAENVHATLTEKAGLIYTMDLEICYMAPEVKEIQLPYVTTFTKKRPKVKIKLVAKRGYQRTRGITGKTKIQYLK